MYEFHFKIYTLYKMLTTAFKEVAVHTFILALEGTPFTAIRNQGLIIETVGCTVSLLYM
jgi:hypothetical protein